MSREIFIGLPDGPLRCDDEGVPLPVQRVQVWQAVGIRWRCPEIVVDFFNGTRQIFEHESLPGMPYSLTHPIVKRVWDGETSAMGELCAYIDAAACSNPLLSED